MSDPAPSAHTPSRSPRDAEPGRPGAVGLVALSAAAFGAMAIFARWAYEAGVDLWGILLPRFVIAAAVFLAIARARRMRIPPGRLPGLAALGALYVAQALCFFGALQFLGAGLVALLLYLFPAFVVLGSRALGQERLTGRRLLALAASLVGVALAIGPGALSGSGGQDPRGIALGVAAACVYAVYILAGTRVTRDVPPIAASAVIMSGSAALIAALVGLRWALGHGIAWPTDPVGWGAVGAAAIVSTVIAVSTFFAGLARLGASRTAVVSTLEPLVTVTLAALLLDERLGPLQALGGALVLGAALLIATEQPEGR
jgi:drug/metabolite transporter (DMT)-like permease